MPQMFKAIAMQSNKPIRKTLSKEVTPVIPETAQWFTFLRCHDELSLELVYVSEEDRAYIHKNYCHKPEWDFRVGEGVSARLSELMKRNPKKIALAYSVMLTLPGTPIIYYGDEFGKLNDEKYYQEKIKETGKDDTRFLVRGKIDWEELEHNLKNPESFSSIVFSKISAMVRARKQYKAFGRGTIRWLDATNHDGSPNPHILAYMRIWQTQQILVIQNLSDIPEKFVLNISPEIAWVDLLGSKVKYTDQDHSIEMKGLDYYWIKL
jgi:maltose alpha-D-glucosyltransferase/alpha-amylase